MLSITYDDLMTKYRTADQLDNLGDQIIKDIGRIMQLKDIRREKDGSLDLSYTMRESLWRLAFEYLYTYAPQAKIEGKGTRGFKDVMDKAQYNMNYKIKREKMGRDITCNLPGFLSSKTPYTEIGKQWGTVAGSSPWGNPKQLIESGALEGGTLGQLFAEIGESIAHEEIEAYFGRILGAEVGVNIAYGARQEAHFSTQAYLLHAAHAGFWKAMMEGRIPTPDERTMNHTLDYFLSLWRELEWAYPGLAEKVGTKYRFARPLDKSPEVEDMNAYLACRYKELKWGPVEEWYPYVIWEGPEKKE